MDELRVGGTIWLRPVRPGSAGRHAPLLRAAGIWTRTLVILALAATLVSVVIARGPAIDEAQASPLATPAAAVAPAPNKAAFRLPLQRAEAALQPWTLLDARPAAPLSPLGRMTDAREALRLATAFSATPGPHSGEFTEVEALDGRSFRAGNLVLTLAGLHLPEAGALCRTLDGRQELCASRAATQLELVTRWRTLSCRYTLTAPGHGTGECTVGGADLAERLLRTGYVKRLVLTEAL